MLPAPSKPSQATGSAQVPNTTNLLPAQPQDPNDTAKNNTVRQANTSLSPDTDGAPSNYTTPTANPPSSVSPPLSDSQPGPQAPAQPATSNGAVVASYNNPSPRVASEALISQTAAENAYYAAGSPQSGPIYERYNAALNATDQAQTQLENAV